MFRFGKMVTCCLAETHASTQEDPAIFAQNRVGYAPTCVDRGLFLLHCQGGSSPVQLAQVAHIRLQSTRTTRSENCSFLRCASGEKGFPCGENLAPIRKGT